MQYQASMQDENNDVVLDFIETHLQGLEGVVRDTIERGLRDAMGDIIGHRHDQNANSTETGAQLDIGEIESDHGDEEADKDTDNARANADADADAEPNVDENKPPRKVELWVDTDVEYNGHLCKTESSMVESPHSLDCPLELEIPNEATDDIEDDESIDAPFPLPGAYTIENETNNSPSDAKSPEPVEEPNEDGDGPNLAPTLVSMPTPPSLKKIHSKMDHFRFSDYESEDCVSVNVLNETYDSKDDFSKICGFTPAEITSGGSNGVVAGDTDLQSIEVSQSEFQVVADAMPEEVSGSEGKSNGLGRKRVGKKLSLKKMLPKWKKKSSKQSADLDGEKGKLYGV